MGGQLILSEETSFLRERRLTVVMFSSGANRCSTMFLLSSTDQPHLSS